VIATATNSVIGSEYGITKKPRRSGAISKPMVRGYQSRRTPP
jgi:hypothetical protein